MSFDYDKLKENTESQNFWATASDLFTTLSVIFLLLYVVSSLRTTTFSVQERLSKKTLEAENQDLRQQIKVYETLKENYLETKASDEELDVYKNLMGQLHLLQNEANQEKNELMKQAKENEKKEIALNQYQQLVRNIINSNLMAKTTLKNRKEELKKVREESDQKIAELEVQYKDIAQNLKKTKSELSVTQQSLASENRKKEMLVAEINQVKSEYEEKASRERQELTAKLKREKMSAQAREAQLKKLQAKQEAELNGKISSLSSEVETNKKELNRAKERLNARKKLAAKIKSDFANAGIDAQVDGETGDVVINFGDEYFDTGKSDLKDKMKSILDQSMPVYARSLFQDPKIAEKVSYVEIVGFASPTYKGKYVDPQSMEENDRKAIEYNLDLSYRRARSIFTHVFDKNKMSYANQTKLRQLVKVTGRSFLAEKQGTSDGRVVASGMDEKEFCKLYDCKKAQKVIIKFDIEN